MKPNKTTTRSPSAKITMSTIIPSPITRSSSSADTGVSMTLDVVVGVVGDVVLADGDVVVGELLGLADGDTVGELVGAVVGAVGAEDL